MIVQIRFIFLVLLLLFNAIKGFAQNQAVQDSLLQVLETDITDKERVDTYNELGELIKNADRNSMALYSRPAIELAKSIDYKKGLAQAYYLHGAKYTYNAQYDSLYIFLDSALFFARAINDQKQIANVYSVKGYTLAYQGLLDESFKFHTEALNIRDSINDYSGMMTSYINIAEYYTKAGKNREAYNTLLSGLQIIKFIPSAPPHFYGVMSNVHANLGNIDSAKYYNGINRRKAEETNNYHQVAGTHLALGSIFRESGDFISAIQEYKKAIDLYIEVDSKVDISTTYQNIGICEFMMNDKENALENFHKALKYGIESNDLSSSCINTNNIAYVHLVNGEIEKCKEYLKKALEYAQQTQSKADFSTVYETYSELYIELKDYVSAIENLQKSNTLFKASGDKNRYTQNLNVMAGFYLKLERFQDALNTANKALTLAKELDAKPLIMGAAQFMSEAYAKLGQGMNAYEAHVFYKAMSDSILNIDKTREFTRIQSDFEFQKEKDSINFAQEKKTLALNTTIEEGKIRQQMTLAGLGAVALILIILSLFFYQNKKKNQQLSELNEEVQNQNAEIKAQRDHLDDLNHTKNKFFSIISHDLRAPMGAFQSLSDIMDYNLKSKNYEELSEVTEEVVKQSKHVSLLLDNLLNWAVNEEGHFPYHPEKINVKKTLEESEAIFSPLAAYKNIDLTFKSDNNHEVLVDKNSFSTIIRNLVSNAIKFTPQSGEIAVTTEQLDENIIIKVQDNGAGIPEERYKKLFVLRENNSSSGTAGEKGVGLGLQLVYDFVQMNKGKIEVESEEGKGTSFIVSLPLGVKKEVFS